MFTLYFQTNDKRYASYVYFEENNSYILLFDISKLIKIYSDSFLGIYESKAVLPAKEVPNSLNKP